LNRRHSQRRTIVCCFDDLLCPELRADCVLTKIATKLVHQIAAFRSFRASTRVVLFDLRFEKMIGYKSLSVLLLEDDSSDAARVVGELNRAGFKVSAHVVSSENAFRKQIAVHSFDLVLADFVNEWGAMDALAILQQLEANIPLIIVTRMGVDHIRAECQQRGVADYVLKKNLHFLPLAVKEAIRARDLNSLKTSTAI
jgi:CheY-like chemotaxis protein